MLHAIDSTGIPFFLGCIAYNMCASSIGFVRPRQLLLMLVVAGAVLQVFSKAAKFSCFKPCEEMVYIGLDEESRTKGTRLLWLATTLKPIVTSAKPKQHHCSMHTPRQSSD